MIHYYATEPATLPELKGLIIFYLVEKTGTNKTFYMICLKLDRSLKVLELRSDNVQQHQKIPLTVSRVGIFLTVTCSVTRAS